MKNPFKKKISDFEEDNGHRFREHNYIFHQEKSGKSFYIWRLRVCKKWAFNKDIKYGKTFVKAHMNGR